MAMMLAVSQTAMSQTLAESPFWCDFDYDYTASEWTLVNGSETNHWIRGNATSSSDWYGGTRSLYITNGSSNSYTGNNGTYSTVFAYVTFDLAAGQYEIQFDWKCNGETDGDFLRVALVPDNVSLVAGDATGWSATTTPGIAVDGGSQLNGSSSWNEFFYQVFSVPTAGRYKLVFAWFNDPYVNNQPPAAVDNIYFGQLSCPFESTATVNNVTTSSATVSWTGGAGQYEVEYGPTGFYQYNGTRTVVNDTTITITGLQTGAYDVYVRKICGVDDTSYSVMATFSTPIAVPYSCDFESVGSRGVWQFDNGSYTNKWRIGSGVSNGGSYSMYISTDNSSYYCNQTSASSVYAYTKIYFDEGYYQMNFDWQCYYSSNIGYMKAFLQKEADWTASHSANGLIDLGQGQMAASSSSWNRSTKQFSITEAGNYYVVFYWYNRVASDGEVSNYYTPGAVDNIQIREACESPSNLSCGDVTTTTATFTWQPPSASSSGNYIVERYDSYIYYYYGAPSQQQAVSDTTFTLTGLTAGTEYYFAVKYVCAPGDTSERVYTSFTTMATAPLTLPYSCDFESGAGSEWNFYNTNSNNTNNWFVGTAANNTTGGSRAMYISNDEGVTNAATYDYGYSGSSFAYVPLTVPAGGYSISFDWRAGGDYNNWLRVALIPVAQGYSSGSWYWSRDNGGNTPGIALDGDARALYDATQWQHFSTEFEVADAGNYYLVFYWKTHSYLADGADPLPAAIDNIVLTALTCPAPSNLAATYTDGDLNLTWTPGGTETSWRVNDGTTDHVVTTPSFAITGAEPLHRYTLSVRAICGDNDVSIATTLVYTTDYWCPGIMDSYTTDTMQSTGTSDVMPIDVENHKSLTEIIFDQSELGDPNYIHAVAFYMDPDNETDTLTIRDSVDIYLMPTTKTAFLNQTDYIVADESSVHVYSGSLNCKKGWNYFEFQTPYLYVSGNLAMIIVDNSDSVYDFYDDLYGNIHFRTRACSGNKTLTQYAPFNYNTNEYPNINPQHPENTFGAQTAIYQYRPEIRLISCGGLNAAYHHYTVQETGLGHVTVTGSSIANGEMVLDNTQITITATPDPEAEIFTLISLKVNGVEVSSPHTMTVTSDVTIEALFEPVLPELHVTSITHSPLVAGQPATVTWTVRNDGLAPTPAGITWNDYVFLCTAPYTNSSGLGDVGSTYYTIRRYNENVTALDTGESYTQTVTFDIPQRQVGEMYIIVTADASLVYNIQCPDSVTAENNNTAPYCTANGYATNICEMSEYFACYAGTEILRHDNFIVKPVYVAIPPLADLQVTNIVRPANFYSGTEVTVTATITNLGGAPTSSSGWNDKLYISDTSEFVPGRAVEIASKFHDVGENHLAQDSSYQVTLKGNVPGRFYGDAWFYVYTNTDDNEFEHLNINNNITRSDVANVILSPHADLKPTSFVIPDNGSNREPLAISYKINNIGLGRTDVDSWYDRIYISSDSTLSGEQVNANGLVYHYDENLGGWTTPLPDGSDWYYVLGEVPRSSRLSSGGSYTVEGVLDLLPSLRFLPDTGEYYFILDADCYHQVFENGADTNNRLVRHKTYHRYLPDFTVTQFEMPQQVTFGHAVNASVTIKNQGKLDFDGFLYVPVYYSTDSNAWNTSQLVGGTYPFDASDDGGTERVTVTRGHSTTVTKRVLFPDDLPDSLYYIYIVVNKGNLEEESDHLNNVFRTGPFRLCHCSMPDLAVSNLHLSHWYGAPNAPDRTYFGAGATGYIEFDVTNTSTDDLPLVDFYTSFTVGDLWCPVEHQHQPASPGSLMLAAGQTRHYWQQVIIPPVLDSGTYTFKLKIDATDNLQEDNKDNNETTIDALVINRHKIQPSADTLIAPTTATSGDNITVSWTVDIANLTWESEEGTVFNLIPIHRDSPQQIEDVQGYTGNRDWNYVSSGIAWYDNIYLSPTPTLDSNSVYIGSRGAYVNQIRTGHYEMTIDNIVLPHSLTGDVYLILVVDGDTLTYDPDRSDNILARPIHINQAAPADLQITSLLIPNDIYQNDNVRVQYTVTNAGTGSTSGSWTEMFFMSDEEVFRKNHYGALAPGESYTGEFILLLTASRFPVGANALTMETDYFDNVYETNDTNNSYTRNVLIQPPRPSDLVVTSIQLSSETTVESNILVQWIVKNNGPNELVGYLRDGIYLSTDNTWSDDDILLGEYGDDISLQPNNSEQRSKEVSIQGIAEGNYYVIVRTNMPNAFFESSYSNNSTATGSQLGIAIPSLVIEQPENPTLGNDKQIAYRMQVGPEYAGQTLQLTLTTAATDAINGLYLSHQTMPTLGHFDYGSRMPYVQKQEIIVPALQEGTYYVLVTASTLEDSAIQNLELLAHVIYFSILDVDASSGSNTGSVTALVTGAKFDTIMDFRLRNGNEYYPAQKVKFQDATKSYVTFNLTDMPTGTYTMEAELPGGVVTLKENAFIVESGLPSELVFNIITSSNTLRADIVQPIQIEYGNSGTTDLNISGFYIEVTGGQISDGVNGWSDTLIVYTAEPGMDPDIIRPGFYGTKTILITGVIDSQRINMSVYAIKREY